MASHLLITPNTVPNAARGPVAQANGEADATGSDVFAALLGASGQQSTAPASTEGSVDLSLRNLVKLALGFGGGEQDKQETEDPEAIAAAIDVQVPFQPAVKPVLGELIESLADLKAKLDAGQPLDPETLKSIDAALQSLAAAFNINLDALPSADELAAMATAELPEGASLQAQLSKALAPLAQELISGSVTDNAELVKSIGDKLAALLKSLNGGDIDPEKLAALGLDAETSATIDPELEVAIAKLASLTPKVEVPVAGQNLAVPTLKLTEPALSGKASEDAPVKVETTASVGGSTPAESTPKDAKDDSSANSGSSDEKKPDDIKAAVTIAATVDKPIDTQVTGQTTQQVSRVDAAAAPRVVQAGYQTSQQQLNLPQLAFELVRQVNDGNTRFQMRLDPPELGRIDVKLDIDSSGQVNARLIVEKAETLDLMQRDQRGLEKALQQAGLDGAKTNLEFSLRQNPGGNQQGQDGNGRQPLFGNNQVAEVEETPVPTVNLYRGSLTASGVNIIA